MRELLFVALSTGLAYGDPSNIGGATYRSPSGKEVPAYVPLGNSSETWVPTKGLKKYFAAHPENQKYQAGAKSWLKNRVKEMRAWEKAHPGVR